MAIFYATSGAGDETATSGAALDPQCPAVVNANDILIAHVSYKGTSFGPLTPAGWTLLFGPANVGTTVAARHWIFGKIAAGTEDSTNVQFGTAGGTVHRYARIYRFQGWVSGSITGVVPSASFTSIPHATDPQGPTVTTTEAGALAVACMTQSDNNVEEAIAGMSGGTWGNYLNYAPGLGTGAALHFCTATPTADPGTISGGAIVAANDPSGTIGFEIRMTAVVPPATILMGPVIGPGQAVFRAATR
jgi:hypothetical protein